MKTSNKVDNTECGSRGAMVRVKTMCNAGRRQGPTNPRAKKWELERESKRKAPDFDVTKASQLMKEGLGLAEGLGVEEGHLAKVQVAKAKRWGQGSRAKKWRFDPNSRLECDRASQVLRRDWVSLKVRVEWEDFRG